jgi:hypothetical protein
MYITLLVIIVAHEHLFGVLKTGIACTFVGGSGC